MQTSTALSLRINAAEFFRDPTFVAWLNNGAPKMTWHTSGEPSEYADVVVMIDPSLNGEGSDSDMPERIWNKILEACRLNIHPRHGVSSGYHILVWLANIEGHLEQKNEMPAVLYSNGQGSDGLVGISFAHAWQMQNALDEMDSPVGSFYGKATATGDVIYSFAAKTRILKAIKTVNAAQFIALMHQCMREMNREHNTYCTDWLKRNAPNMLALNHGIAHDFTVKALEHWVKGDAGNPAIDALHSVLAPQHERFTMFPTHVKLDQ